MKIEWRIVSPEEVADREAHRCTSRRSRRSRIRCEMDIRDSDHTFHAGRGELGQWFTWRVSERDLGASHREGEPSVRETDPA